MGLFHDKASWQNPFYTVREEIANSVTHGIGAALAALYAETDCSDRWVMRSPYLGPEYSDCDIAEALGAAGFQFYRSLDVAGEAAHRCTGTDCVARRKESLRHFVSKNAIDIEGLGPKVLSTLVDEGLVDLDAPVRDWLPDFRVADRSVTRSVTARHFDLTPDLREHAEILLAGHGGGDDGQ